MQVVLYTDDDDDFSDLDASSLDFLRNLDMQISGSLRWNDNDLETIPGERVLYFYSHSLSYLTEYLPCGLQKSCGFLTVWSNVSNFLSKELPFSLHRLAVL